MESGLGFKLHQTFKEGLFPIIGRKRRNPEPRSLSIYSNNVILVCLILGVGSLISLIVLVMEFFSLMPMRRKKVYVKIEVQPLNINARFTTRRTNNSVEK